MSWDYRIVAPAEVMPLMADPAYYVPRTPLGSFRGIFDWLASRATEWHARDSDCIVVTIGEDGYVVLHLVTLGWHKMMSEHERARPVDGKCVADPRCFECYKPRDDEGVIEISLEGRGTGDIGLIAQCAAWLNAAVFDCQTSEVLTPQQWVEQGKDKLHRVD